MKIKIIIIINIVITIAFISIIGILLIKNNKEVHTWKNAIEDNESSAISNYIKQYPNGIFEKSAFQKIDEFTWNKALLSNSVESYREYKKTFPKGKFVSIADELIQEDESASTFTDSRDGNVYKFVTIGKQVWMAENLKYLPVVVKPSTESRTDPHYYVYDYDGTNVNAAKATASYTTYGVLYNWPAAMARSASSTANPSKVQGVCPTGWHLPSDAEWTQLIDYLGGDEAAGGKLKESGTAHWKLWERDPNVTEQATNETGFTALPGGYRNYLGTFAIIGNYGYWWSATESRAANARGRGMSDNDSDVGRYNNYKEVGFSVRCVRD